MPGRPDERNGRREQSFAMLVLAGMALMVTNALVATEVPFEVIAGFNVDGLALVGMAVGAVVVLYGLLRSGSELPMDRQHAGVP
jgi:hypothetical protein